jgi:predicted glutamine amidotransferase
LNEFAYADGATLIRKTEYYKKETKTDNQLTSLLALKDDLIKETGSLSESDLGLLKRINSDLDKLNELTESEKKAINKTSDLVAVSKKNDSLQPYLLSKEELFKTTESIAVDLKGYYKKQKFYFRFTRSVRRHSVYPKKIRNRPLKRTFVKSNNLEAPKK